MLFLADLLKFKTAFGKLWLAGTVGAKKRPFNKDIISNSDIDTYVEALFSVDSPLAPRLSGTLLCGVCNIYDQKCHFLYLDVLALFKKLFNQKSLALTSSAERIKRHKRRKHSGTENSEDLIVKANPTSAIEQLLANLEFDAIEFNIDVEQPDEDMEDTTAISALLEQSMLDDAALSHRRYSDTHILKDPDALTETFDQPTQIDPLPYFEENDSDNDSDNHSENQSDNHSDNESISHASDTASIHDLVDEHMIDSEHHPLALISDHETPVEVCDQEIRALEIEQTPPPLENPALEHTEQTKVQYQRRRHSRLATALLDKCTILSDVTLTEWHKELPKRAEHRGGCPYYQNNSCHRQDQSKSSFKLERLLNQLQETRKRASLQTLSGEAEGFKLDGAFEENMSGFSNGPFQSSGTIPHQVLNSTPKRTEDNPFAQIERLRGIFDIDDEARYENTTLRYQMKRDTVLRPSTADDISSRHSILSSAAQYQKSNSVFPQSDFYGSRASGLDSNQYGRDSVTSLQNVEHDTLYHPSLLIQGQRPLSLGHSVTSSCASQHYSQYAYTMETWKFRNFIESRFQHQRDLESLSFFDIVPPNQVDVKIAAKSFYQLLVLVASGDVEVLQDSNSHEIFILNTNTSSLGEKNDTSIHDIAQKSSPQIRSGRQVLVT